jgi:hypothetical protein
MTKTRKVWRFKNKIAFCCSRNNLNFLSSWLFGSNYLHKEWCCYYGWKFRRCWHTGEARKGKLSFHFIIPIMFRSIMSQLGTNRGFTSIPRTFWPNAEKNTFQFRVNLTIENFISNLFKITYSVTIVQYSGCWSRWYRSEITLFSGNSNIPILNFLSLDSSLVGFVHRSQRSWNLQQHRQFVKWRSPNRY